ncbi:hypothetical protein HDU99_005991 [Rhizoclosmatium hyalinum]|nr:hypothetical protein HDU99_005991 [Rhizoclosmatium hyalinum]
MAETSVLYALGANVGINLVGYAVSAALQTEHFYDMCGTGSFLAGSLAALLSHPGPVHTRQWLMLATTGTWAARLLHHLVTRVHRMGGDRRFDNVKTKPLIFLIYWTVQVIWVAVVSMPTIVVLSTDSKLLPNLSWLDYVGLTVWTLGFVFETVADRQKAVWQNKHGKNRFTKFIDTGLWSWCRYPNYFGEISLWVGSYVMATCAFPDSQLAKYGFAASPLFITYILTRLSGIPLQEAQARKRFKGNAEYAAYVKSTNLLFPWPFKRASKAA